MRHPTRGEAPPRRGSGHGSRRATIRGRKAGERGASGTARSATPNSLTSKDEAKQLRRGRRMPAYHPRGRIFRVDRSAWWFQEQAWFRVSDIPLQTIITGATGSGKTSCVVHTIVRKGTRHGVPFLIYCAKQEDAADFTRYIEAGGGFAVTVSPAGANDGPPPYVFPFLRYLEAHNVATLDIVEVLIAAMNALDGGSRAQLSGDQSFWNKSMRVVLARVITLLRASELEFSLKNLMRAMGDLPVKGVKAPFFFGLMMSASSEPDDSVVAAIRYFEEEFRTLEPRTSGSIRAVWSAMAAELEQAPLDRLLADPVGDQLIVTPSTVLDDRIPVILDLPTLVYPRSGGVFQALFHQCLKIALHQRAPDSHVVGIVQDEFQASVPSRRELTDIMTTARSKGVGGIYATQALSNVMAVYGREDARAIFGTPNLLIACKNDDADTKQFVSERAGEAYVAIESRTKSEDGQQATTTQREERRPVLEPWGISELKRPTKKQWRPQAETFALRNGGVYVVRFDRMPFGLARAWRGLIGHVVDDRQWSVWHAMVTALRVAIVTIVLTSACAIALMVAYASTVLEWIDERYFRTPHPRLAQRAAPETIHTVQRGETLGAIARRYGIRDLAALAAANQLPSIDRIEVGQRLRMPTYLRRHTVAHPAPAAHRNGRN